MSPVIEPMTSFDKTNLEPTPLESNPKPSFPVFWWSVMTNMSERSTLRPVYLKNIRFKWHILEKNAALVDVISWQNIQWQCGDRANIFCTFRSDCNNIWATWDSLVKNGTETNLNNTFTFFEFHFNNIFPLTPRPIQVLSFLYFSNWNRYAFSCSPYVSRPAHLILGYFLSRGGEFKFWSSSFVVFSTPLLPRPS